MHISIDASGSMGGAKWENTIRAVVAIAKALTYTQNINLQISLRYTDRSDKPFIYTIYNSKKNKLAHLTRILSYMRPTNYTPEGLCFEAMYNQNQFIAGTSDLDSYFINFSDGQPCCSGYSGQDAGNHTKRWIDKLRTNLNMKVLSFYIHHKMLPATATAEERAKGLTEMQDSFNHSSDGKLFRLMYGKDATAIDPTSVMEIAKSLNKTFMAAKA